MRFVLAMVAALFLMSMGGVERPACAGAGGLLPDVPKATGGTCVRDAAFMRVNHMDFLKHRRDASVLAGERKREESLNTCLTCHAVHGDGGQPVGFDSSKHFCRTCHDYAAVRVDCFECHNAKPGPPLVQTNTPAEPAK
jgi:hypothetical protein